MSERIRSIRPTRRALCAVLAALAALWSTAAPSAAQESESEAPFVVEAVAVRGAAPGAVRVDVHTRVPYAHLRFLNEAQGFGAGYEVMAELYRADDRGRRQDLVLSKIWRREVPRVADYERTRSDIVFDYTIQALPRVDPGQYELEVRLEDAATRIPWVQTIPLEVRDLWTPVAVSDLLLMDERPQGGLARPNVVRMLGTEESEIVLAYEIYSNRRRTVRLTYDIYRMIGRGRSMRKADDPEQSLAGIDPTTLRPGVNAATSRIPTNRLRVGYYTVALTVVDADGLPLAETEKTFAIRFERLDSYVRDLDKAIAQLEHIAKKRDREAMARAATPEERRRLFDEFWKKRDPTPRTPRNERMEEYYYRVAFADKSYSTRLLRGWQTDRGQVFIRFGDPDDIARYALPVEGGGALEIWTYEDINRQFIFTDTDDEGFKLFKPVWDSRTRVR